MFIISIPTTEQRPTIEPNDKSIELDIRIRAAGILRIPIADNCLSIDLAFATDKKL